MDKLCVVCFEEMDMLTFKDEHESTSTCFKLRCGHAFHTKCIVECLQKTNQDCPSCHGPKDIRHQLTREGMLRNMVNELKKDNEVKEAISEYKEAKQELKETNQQLKKDIKEFAKKRKEELEFNSKHKYFLKTISNVKHQIRQAAKKKGPQYQGIFVYRTARHIREGQLEQLALNGYGYSYYRLKRKDIRIIV